MRESNERPFKVAILGTRGYPSFYGGFETAVRALAPYLCERGIETTVYSRPRCTVEDMPDRDPRVKVVFTRGLEKKSISTLSYGFTAALCALHQKPDAVLVMNVANGYFLPLLKLRGIPTVVNVDGIEWKREKWNALAKKIFLWGAKLTARYADALVSDAHEIGHIWKKEFGRDSEFIPYGGTPIDNPELKIAIPARGYALAVARFVPENSIPEFFAAAEKIAERYPVIIVGSTGFHGELDDQAQKLADRNANIQWLGHVADDDLLFGLWAHAGVYFHGHSVGGTNPALIQAITMGAPVLARDTPFNREVLGELGRYVAPDPIAIAEEALSILDSNMEQDRLSKLSRARAAEDYTWESVNGKYLALLRKVAQATLEKVQ